MSSNSDWAGIRKRYVALMATLEARFKSGNEVPVERIHLRREEWAVLEEYDQADEAMTTDMAMKLSDRESALRDYFAAQAMVIKFGPRGSSMPVEELATKCYQMADAMLRAREGS